MDFEAILKEVGPFGRYQKCVLLLFSLLILVNTTHLYIQVFSSGKDVHWCKSWPSDDCSNLVISNPDNCEDLKRRLSIPKTNNGEVNNGSGGYDQCTKYNVSGIDLQTAIDLGDDVTKLDVIPCDEGWEYDRSTFPSTIIQDFELVCGKSYLPNIAQSAYFVGYLVGSAIAGLAADVVGRRVSLLLNVTAAFAVGLVTMFTPNIGIFIALRFLMAVAAKGIGLICFVSITEVVSPSKRILVGNVLWIFFAIGYFVLSGMAKLIANWRLLSLILTLPYIVLLVILFFFLQESPRWLLLRNDSVKTQQVLTKIASINRRSAPDEEVVSRGNPDISENNATFDNLKELIRTPAIVLIVVNMSFNWMVQNLVFYGLSLSTSSLGIDPYLSFIFSGFVEIPAYICCIFVAQWSGRKVSTVVTMLLGGLCCCSTALIPIGISRAAVAMGGKFFITMSYSIVYTWAAELMPTPLRSSGLGLFSLISRIGSIVAPLILLLEELWGSLPYLIFGSFALTAGLLCLLLPETKGKPLPSSVDDTKALYKKAKKADDGDEEQNNGTPSNVSEKPAVA
ncbi:solute carrier family 22 member 13-like [Apostichopus japonicus]|uniref:solute carrier family 22 member 13-like n=1 Tax=Stichopus japonicus TaxID=307972 RepID=UPI003AB5C38C